MTQTITTGMQPAVQCELVTEFSRLEEMAPEWQKWTRQNERSSIFQSWEWARAYWKAYGSSLSLCSLAMHQDGRVLGILPLVRRGQRIEFLGSVESDYNDLLCEEGWAASVLAAALEFLLHLPFEWNSGVFENLPAQSSMVLNLTILPARIRRHLQLVFQCPCPAIGLNSNRDDELRALINKDQLKRYHKKLQKLGSLSFHHIDRRDEARQHLNRFFHQHITRWGLSGQRSQFLQPDRRAFYEALVEELDPAGELRFGVLQLNSRPIAYHFGFQSHGKLTYYKPTFDVNYWDLCPGDVLLRHLFQYAGEVGVRELDFTIGDEQYKYRYANQVNHNYALYMDHYPARIQTLSHRMARHVQHSIRQRPALKGVLKSAAQRLEEILSFVSQLRGKRLLQCTVSGIRSACRNLIWSNEEALFFSSTGEPIGPVSETVVCPASLETLACLALEYPKRFSEARVRLYRARLKAGDKVFVGRDSGGVAVLWAGNLSGLRVPEIARDYSLPLGAPPILLYDIWMSPNFRAPDSLPDVLRALAIECCDSEMWVLCSHCDVILRRALQEAGFGLKSGIVSRSFLRWFRRSRVVSFGRTADSQSRPVCRDRLRVAD